MERGRDTVRAYVSRSFGHAEAQHYRAPVAGGLVTPEINYLSSRSGPSGNVQQAYASDFKAHFGHDLSVKDVTAAKRWAPRFDDIRAGMTNGELAAKYGVTARTAQGWRRAYATADKNLILSVDRQHRDALAQRYGVSRGYIGRMFDEHDRAERAAEANAQRIQHRTLGSWRYAGALAFAGIALAIGATLHQPAARAQGTAPPAGYAQQGGTRIDNAHFVQTEVNGAGFFMSEPLYTAWKENQAVLGKPISKMSINDVGQETIHTEGGMIQVGQDGIVQYANTRDFIEQYLRSNGIMDPAFAYSWDWSSDGGSSWDEKVENHWNTLLSGAAPDERDALLATHALYQDDTSLYDLRGLPLGIRYGADTIGIATNRGTFFYDILTGSISYKSGSQELRQRGIYADQAGDLYRPQYAGEMPVMYFIDPSKPGVRLVAAVTPTAASIPSSPTAAATASPQYTVTARATARATTVRPSPTAALSEGSSDAPAAPAPSATSRPSATTTASPSPSATSVPPTVTASPPPSATSVPPTVTASPPPSATSVPPTATASSTSTSTPPATPIPPAATPTGTPAPPVPATPTAPAGIP